nr:hypothetical protein [uncultured Pseudomonas sp.]
MSNFLSTPVFLAHKQAQTQGLNDLSRSEFLEVAASSLAYEHYRLMKPMLPGLEAAIKKPDAAVILDESAATRRAAGLLDANGVSKRNARQYVAILSSQLAEALPGKVYTNEGDFLSDHLDPHAAEHFLRELDANPLMQKAHAKVRARCEIVEEEDSDYASDFWRERKTWHAWSAVAIYARRDDGKADIGGEYLLANCDAAYSKLERAVVSTQPIFQPARASAHRYHAGMGGENIE